jgi:L-threonylcarbamoyladenylate synthase
VTLTVYPASNADAIDRALEVVRCGGLVAYPTDTVYGLAADPANDAAVERLFAAKRRRPDQSTPLLVAGAEDAGRIAAAVPAVARELMRAFWPGALTIVLAKAAAFHSRAVTGDTVGLRVPGHDVARALAAALGGPITGTSANLAGGPEPLTAADVVAQLGDAIDLVLDGGPCPGGVPSTVVDCTATPPRIVREGAIDREALGRAAGVRFE